MKIPVGKTIEDAYGFAFSNFLNIVGIAWLPIVALGVLVFACSFALIAPGHEAHDAPIGTPQGLETFALVMLDLVGFLATFSMIYVGILRRALGLDTGPAFFYFSLGPTVWRMIASWFLAALAIACLGLILFVVGSLMVYILAAALPPVPAGIVSAIVTVVGVCIYISSAVRLAFLLPAVVVAQDSIGIGAAWSLTRGSFWRIVVIWLATVLPWFIAFCLVAVVFSGVPDVHTGVTAQAALRNAEPSGPMAVVIFLVVMAFLVMRVGLSSGASAKAYLAVTTGGDAS